ncbi:flagellar hook-length control protein FliK [Salinicola sp. DM10]|uniref:flagellar hook-length control protein FliK n=1 Tax=Salinicola sp. DM10 TaxID=2815721 RepID=UPI001A8C77F6|nr:flagellar hook-length control protein FliK [Salinicola sp. DM10]MCE3025810.1 flagellar hook-length control protein FliK [Salinicola sp. DM10]
MTAAGDKAASAKSSGEASSSTSFAAALTQAGAQPRSPSDASTASGASVADATGGREARPDTAQLPGDTNARLSADQADTLAKLTLADTANASGDDIAEALSALRTKAAGTHGGDIAEELSAVGSQASGNDIADALSALLEKGAGATDDAITQALTGADGQPGADNGQTDALALAALFAGLQPLGASSDARLPAEARAGQLLTSVSSSTSTAKGLAGSTNMLASAIGLATRDLTGRAPADDGEAALTSARALSSALDSAAAQRHGDTLAQRDTNARGESPLAALLTRTAAGQQAQAQAAAGTDAPLTAEQLAARAQTAPQGVELSALSRGHGTSTEATAGFAGQLQQQSGSPMTMPPSGAPAAVPSHTLPVAVQSPQWPASLGQQVLQMQQRGDNQMQLKLHPRELGALSVSLNVQDNQAQLQILSAHAPVRAAVEAALPQLREALAQSGIALGEAMVGDHGQFQREQQESDGRGASGSALGTSGLATLDEPADAATATLNTLLGARGNINLYA